MWTWCGCGGWGQEGGGCGACEKVRVNCVGVVIGAASSVWIK